MNLLDPRVAARRRTRVTWAVAAPIALGCWAWGLWPSGRVDVSAPVIAPVAKQASVLKDVVPIDQAAFDAPIWVVPPAPLAAAPEPAAPPPEPAVKFQLVGITEEKGASPALRAAIYDPKSDRIFVVASGDKVGTHTVRSVTETSVELASGRSVTTLVLDEDATGRTRRGGRL